MPQEKKDGGGVADAWLETTLEDPPTLEGIELFAAGGLAPMRWPSTAGRWATKVLFILTNQKYSPVEAEKLWHAIVDHEKWMAVRFRKECGSLTLA